MKKLNILFNSKNKRSSEIVYLGLSIITIICIIVQLINQETEKAVFCFVYLLVLMLPKLLQKRFKFRFSNFLEIVIYLSIFSGTILGSTYNFFSIIPLWDTIIHGVNGFICAGIGVALYSLVNKNHDKVKISPIYLVLFGFCFSITAGLFWEFYEYGCDKLFNADTLDDQYITKVASNLFQTNSNRKAVVIDGIKKTILYDAGGNELLIIDGGYLDIGLNDTMHDLLVTKIGALTFSIMGYFYLKDVKKFKFIKYFIPNKNHLCE